MKISLEKAGKRYIKDWVFKKIDFNFEPNNSYVLLGTNGSGKSTLLRILAGMQTLSVGNIHYQFQGNNISAEKIFSHISFCAPAMELIEEMTLHEFLTFHFSFKKIKKGWTIEEIIEKMQLKLSQHKLIADYSSGMKQRVKLAQAFFSDTSCLMLDEPCSNLDLQGVLLYQEWLQELTENRLVIIASNDEREYQGVTQSINILEYK
ncbi:MAG TPA: ATP-binding cassette domain-containing protein [Edaphocola sp.]|nr:ATP-binding cassette domain-containing protein [Edaphocola sp.]